MTGDARRRRALPIAAAVIAFLVGLVAWFPAAWALRLLPSPLSCAGAGGTVWQGRCAELRHGTTSIGDLSWRLHPSQLLRARIAADIAWDHRTSRIISTAVARRGEVSLAALRGEADIATLRAMPLWPPSWVSAWPPSEGLLSLDLTEVLLRDGRLARIVGTVEVRGLVSAGRERWRLGDHRLTWREGASPHGDITDLGGPLELRARLRPDDAPGAVGPPGGAWLLEGTVRAREPAWTPRLLVFGPADAAGRHAMSVAWR